MSRIISDTKVPTLIVSKYDLGEIYPAIGYGSEGSVYNYNDEYALKTFSLFRAMEYFYKERVDLKFKKVEEMTKLNDKSICFPKGILGYRDQFMEGAYYPLIKYIPGRKDFDDLQNFDDVDEKIDMLIKGDNLLIRAHQLGLVIGDVKEDNIMITEDGNPILVDVDNCAFGDYGFDLFPDRASLYETLYGHEGKYTDNDIMLYTLMVLRIIFSEKNFCFGESRENLEKLVNNLDVSGEIKKYITLLLSDAKDKPYVGPLLQMIKKDKK